MVFEYRGRYHDVPAVRGISMRSLVDSDRSAESLPSDAGQTIAASVVYLERERLLVDLPHGTLVADHPTNLGGDGLGPSAAELLLLAVTSSAAMAMSQSLPDGRARFVSRAGFTTVRAPSDGPLTSLARMAELHLHAESNLPDTVTAGEMMAAASASPVALALSAGIDVDEHVQFRLDDGPRTMNPFLNETMLASEQAFAATAKADTSVVSSPEPSWRVSSESLDAWTALAHHRHQTYLVADPSNRGVSAPNPNELLAAGLAACTVFYIAHNARFRSIPTRRIAAVVDGAVSPSGQITSLRSVAMVDGNLTDDEMDSIRYIAGHCYVGQTFRAGVPVIGSASESPSPARQASDVAIVREDGSCCIPQFD